MRRATWIMCAGLGCSSPTGLDPSTESEETGSEATGSDSDTEASGSDSGSDTDTGDTDTGEVPSPRILFIGNSYTFYNDLPGLFGAMTAAADEPWIVDSISIAGATVGDHLASPELGVTLLEGWDLVVIQGQSSEPITQPLVFEQAVVELATLIDQNTPDAQLLLFETWAREPGDPLLSELGMSAEEMQQALTDGYAAAARASGGTVAPVGRAWAQTLIEAPAIVVFDADGSHPSLAGSFLATTVFFGISTGLPATSSDFLPEGLAPADADTLESIADASASP